MPTRGNVVMPSRRAASRALRNELGGSHVKRSEGAKRACRASESSNDIVATASPEKHGLWYFCWFCVFSVESVPVPSSPLSPGGTGGRCGSLNPLVSCLVRNAYWGREKKKGCKMKIKPGNGARKPRFPLPVEFFFCMQEASWFSFVWSLLRAMTFPGLTVVRGHLCHSPFQSFRILPSFSQLSGLRGSAGLLRTREFTRYNLKGREGERRGQN